MGEKGWLSRRALHATVKEKDVGNLLTRGEGRKKKRDGAARLTIQILLNRRISTSDQGRSPQGQPPK